MTELQGQAARAYGVWQSSKGRLRAVRTEESAQQNNQTPRTGLVGYPPPPLPRKKKARPEIGDLAAGGPGFSSLLGCGALGSPQSPTFRQDAKSRIGQKLILACLVGLIRV
jgi:hypothetical protein